MGALGLNLNKVLPYAHKPMTINVSMSAALKLDLVPASRYKCNVK